MRSSWWIRALLFAGTPLSLAVASMAAGQAPPRLTRSATAVDPVRAAGTAPDRVSKAALAADPLMELRASCLCTEGNTAWIGGVVHVGPGGSVGRAVVLQIIDGGVAQDTVRIGFVVDPAECLLRPEDGVLQFSGSQLELSAKVRIPLDAWLAAGFPPST